MAFDASVYLRRIDPGRKYEIHRASGGVVNVTLRAVKTATTDTGDEETKRNSIGRFPSHSTLILKHALPFIAGVGPEAPLTLFRQTIEARALALFDATEPLSLCQLLNGVDASIPQLLYFDEQNHVLILSDLGALPNLSDIFSALGGFSPGEPRPADSGISKRPLLSSISISTFSLIGQAMGTFFARLHSPDTIHTILQHRDPSYFTNDSLRETVLKHAIKPVIDQLKLFPDLIRADEADTLGASLISDFKRPLHDAERSFVIGDCWTGTILVDAGTRASAMAAEPQTDLSNLVLPNIASPGAPRVCIIDWEFASLGRGPHGDMSQLLAHLELLRIAAEYQKRQYHLQCVDELVRSITIAYSDVYQITDLPQDVELAVMRSAFLSHGAEIVNNAFWKMWICEEPDCPAMLEVTDGRSIDGLRHGGKAEQCALIKRMVKSGLWFLRIAGASPEQFRSNMHGEIAQEREQQKEKSKYWLMDLFGSRYISGASRT